MWGGGNFVNSWKFFYFVSLPGTALGALGVRWAIRKGQRQWFSWTAFGLNVGPAILGFFALLVYIGLLPGSR